MKQKTLAICLAALMLVLAGCGGGNGMSNTASGGSTAARPSSPSVAEDSNGYWDMGNRTQILPNNQKI